MSKQTNKQDNKSPSIFLFFFSFFSFNSTNLLNGIRVKVGNGESLSNRNGKRVLLGLQSKARGNEVLRATTVNSLNRHNTGVQLGDGGERATHDAQLTSDSRDVDGLDLTNEHGLVGASQRELKVLSGGSIIGVATGKNPFEGKRERRKGDRGGGERFRKRKKEKTTREGKGEKKSERVRLFVIINLYIR